MYEKKETFPKVLVISHNVFSNTSNMGRTLKNFFIGWDKDSLAQLYLRSEIPTTNICENYFRITDFDMLKKSKKDIGTLLGMDDINYSVKNERIDKGVQSKIYQQGRQRKPYMYIGRNLLWATKKWKNKKFLDWVDSFNPDIIFFASGDYAFSYKIAMDIAKYKNIPILTYICDDYYFLKRKSLSPLYYLNKFSFKQTLKKLFKANKNIVAICDKISTDYAAKFDLNASTIMTSSTVKAKKNNANSSKISISYIGNLGYNRHIMLTEIGNTLKELFGDEYFIDVYSTEKRPHILEKLSEENEIHFKGALSYDEVNSVMNDSDILIHTESFNKLSREKVKYSVSTKIADTLYMGKALLAYGPSDVASIEYLRDSDCACVATNKEMLKEKLYELITNRELREEYSRKAIAVASKNHDIEKNCEKFRKVIFNILKR